MKKYLVLAITSILTIGFALTVNAFTIPFLGGGTGTINRLSQWTASTSPDAIFPRNGSDVGLHITGSTQCLRVTSSGVIEGTGADCGAGGGGGNSAFTIGNGYIYNATSSDQVLIGASATSTNSQLEVTNDVNAEYFTASSTTATSTFPNLSATNSEVGTVRSGTWNGSAVDVSDYTNLTAASPVTLTDDQVGFDLSQNLTWTGTGTTTFDGNAWVKGDLRVDGAFFAPVSIVSSGDLDMGGNDINNLGNINGQGAITVTPASGSGLAISLATTGDFTVNTDDLVVDTSAGNVGIGTASPSEILTVAGGTNPRISITDTGHTIATMNALLEFDGTNGRGGYIGLVENDLLLNATSDINLNGGGNVGIGTTSPSSVFGAIRVLSIEGTSAGLTLNSTNGSSGGIIEVLNGQPLRLVTGGTEKVRIDSSGNVGIGTTGPSNKLHVAAGKSSGTGAQFETPSVQIVGANTGQTRLTVQQESTGDASLEFLLTGTRSWNLGIDNSDSDKFKISSADDNFASTQLTIDTSGNVGIGMANPSTQLNLYRNTSTTNNPQVRIEEDGTGDPSLAFVTTGVTAWGVGIDNSDSDKFKLGYSSDLGANNSVTIDTSGNVGIGTTGPDAKLDVLSTTGAQARLTYTDGSVYTDLETDSAGDLNLYPSSGKVWIESGNVASRGLSIDISQYNNQKIDPIGTGTGLKIGTQGDVYYVFKAGGNASTLYHYFRNDTDTGFYQSTDAINFVTGGSDAMSISSGSVGIGTTSPNTLLHVDGGYSTKVTTVNAATYDLLVSDSILSVSYTSTAAVTSLTLPSAQTTSGRVVVIKDAGGNAATNNITIDTEGSETIDGSATYVMDADYEAITLYSDGTNWFVY